jgi:hypothetical protein
MTRCTVLFLVPLGWLLLIPRLGAEPPESKCASKYLVELEVRKAGAPRTVAGEVFHDGDRLYYASADSRALA